MKGRAFIVILKELNSRTKVTAVELAQELGVSVRTIYRYLDELTASGLPIDTERGKYGGFFKVLKWTNIYRYFGGGYAEPVAAIAKTSFIKGAFQCATAQGIYSKKNPPNTRVSARTSNIVLF